MSGPAVDPARWSIEERATFYARRQARNTVLGLVLSGLAALFFGITVVRMTGPDVPSAPAAASAAGIAANK